VYVVISVQAFARFGKKEDKQTMNLSFAAVLLVVLAASMDLAWTGEDAATLIAKASKKHPRLFINSKIEAALRKKVTTDPLLKKVHAYLMSQADRYLKLKPVEHKKTGRRLLGVSRECLRRVNYWAYAYRATKDRKYLERAQEEMLAAAAFKDWNPSHFLDVAEMTAALAVGYDWLYDDLDADARKKIKAAIVEKGLNASLKVKGWWVRGNNNWNQVCHGGMVLGALAVLEDEPELAAKIVARAVDGVPYAIKEYAPDGAYPEGPGYWGYGTTYNVVLIDALESVLGTDFGLTQKKGYLKTPEYFIHVTGPTGLFFNYCDSGLSTNAAPAMFWFAARKKDPGLLCLEKQKIETRKIGAHRWLPQLLIWSPPVAGVKLPTKKHYTANGRTPIACHRTGWGDPNAVFLAIKGGSPSDNHAHMDCGSFVMDADGVRWAADLGAQSYHDLESKGIGLWDKKQKSDRWTVFRLNNLCHNTLVVNGKHQLVKGRAPITQFKDDGPMPHTIIDLTTVYADQLSSAVRGAGLRADGTVLIQDEVQAGKSKATVRWGMVTRADVKLNGRSATLEREKQKLGFLVLSPKGTKLKIYNTEKPPSKHDAPNKGTRMIGFEVTLEPSASERLVVLLVPGNKPTKAPELKPLKDW